MNTPAEMPFLMTAREFSEYARIRFEAVYTLWAQGRGPEKTRRGKHVYITRDDADRWLLDQDSPNA
jgi:hypothetical protein